MDKILNQPSLAEVMAEIKAVNRHTTQTNENVTVIKNTIEKCASMSGDTSATSGYKKMRTWAQMAAGAPPMHVSPPTSFLQPSTGMNTTKPEISQKADRTITIKLHDPEAQKLYRQRPSSHSLKRVNDALSKSGNSAINKLKMLAFNQLKSGDITLLAATVADMENLLKNHEEWAGILGTKAQVVVPTFGVIAHGVPTASMHLETDTAAEGMQNKLQAQNTINIPGVEIQYLGLASTYIQDQDTLFPGGGNVYQTTRQPGHPEINHLGWTGLYMRMIRQDLQDQTMLQMPQIRSRRIPMPGPTATLQFMCRTSYFK